MHLAAKLVKDGIGEVEAIREIGTLLLEVDFLGKTAFVTSLSLMPIFFA